jgi:hypothetical protein
MIPSKETFEYLVSKVVNSCFAKLGVFLSIARLFFN